MKNQKKRRTFQKKSKSDFKRQKIWRENKSQNISKWQSFINKKKRKKRKLLTEICRAKTKFANKKGL